MDVQNGHPAKNKVAPLLGGCPVTSVHPLVDEYLIVVTEYMGMGTLYGGPYYIFSGIDAQGFVALYELYQYDTLDLTDFEYV
jgi:hypothetical protein